MKKALFFMSLVLLSFCISAQTLSTDTTFYGSLVSKAPDATSVTYLWTQVSGPNTAKIVSPTSLQTNATGLISGTYIFQLVGTDNFGVSSLPSKLEVDVARNAIAPVVSAGTSPISVKLGTK